MSCVKAAFLLILSSVEHQLTEIKLFRVSSRTCCSEGEEHGEKADFCLLHELFKKEKSKENTRGHRLGMA